MFKNCFFLGGLIITSTLMSLPASAEDVNKDRGMFSQFLGVNQQGKARGEDLARYLTFDRLDFAWRAIEGEPGKWNEKQLDDWGRMVLEHQNRGVELLPVLCYSTGWAARKKAWSFTVAGKKYDVQAWEPGQKIDERKAIVTDISTGKTGTEVLKAGQIPPENIGDWEAYVEKVVGFLSNPPYNVRYFQIWNEANDLGLTGFWYGSMDDYMQTIHLPAAKIIRQHGAKVVYGGYPCNGKMKHYLQILDQNKAWDTLDVLDIHYYPLSSWQFLYDRIARDKRDVAIWQTELGADPNPAFVPNNYPRFFHWALSHGWAKDRYRIFHFAYWSPDDPKAYGYNWSFYTGDKPSHHGKALLTLGKLLDGPEVKPYVEWETTPSLKTEIDKTKSSVEGFDCGDRIVLAVHLADQNSAAMLVDRDGDRNELSKDSIDTRMEVILPRLEPADIKGAWRIGIYGSEEALEISPAAPEGIKISPSLSARDPVERKDNREGRMHTFYLLLQKTK